MQVKPLIDRTLKSFFFQPADSKSLSLFRFLYCSLLIWRIARDGAVHLSKFGIATWNPIPLFDWFGVGLMSREAFQVLQVVLVAALALTAVGAFTRIAAHVAWISFFFYMATFLGFSKTADSSYVYHSKNIVVFILFILAVAPGVSAWGLDGWRRRGWKWRPSETSETTISNWPSQLIKVTLGLAYFGSGYCKHFLWADGYTLQAYLTSKHLLLGESTQWGMWLAEQYWICLFLSISTVILELTFIVVVFFPRLTWFYVFGGLSFHSMVWVTMKISFFPYFGFVYLIFLDWPTLTRLATPIRYVWNRFGADARRAMSAAVANRTTQVVGDTLHARRTILGMSGMLLFCVIARVECWPLTDYRVFQSRNHLSRVEVYRFATVDRNGNLTWVEREDLPISPTALNSRCQHGDDAARQRILDEVATHIAKSASPDTRLVTIVKRTIAMHDGTPIITDQTVQQTPVMSMNYPAEQIARDPDAVILR